MIIKIMMIIAAINLIASICRISGEGNGNPLQYSCLEKSMDRRWTEEPGRLQSMGSQRVRHDGATSLHSLSFTSYFITGEGNGNPLQYSCLENPMDRGTWRATAHGVAESDMTAVTKHEHM